MHDALKIMLSLSNSDTTNCVVYLENYLDCVENLPDDLQKNLTRMRELDVLYQGFLHDVESLAAQYEECVSFGKTKEKNRLLRKAQSTLLSARELGDEKLQIVQHLQDLIENRTRLLDNDYRNIDNGSKERDTVLISSSTIVGSSNTTYNTGISTETTMKEPVNVCSSIPSSSNGNGEQRQSKRVRRGRPDTDTGGNNSDHNSLNHQYHHHHYSEHGGSIPMPRVTATLLINNQKKHSTNNLANNKKKKRKTKQQLQRISFQKEEDNRSNNTKTGANDDDDEEVSIDPDEPTYCLCDQISYGEMICCDNDLCPIEWFHFSCVSLTTKPKGKWFCPKCRGDRPNVMKPKAQFLKELERYNREKEEKARSY